MGKFQPHITPGNSWKLSEIPPQCLKVAKFCDLETLEKISLNPNRVITYVLNDCSEKNGNLVPVRAIDEETGKKTFFVIIMCNE